MTLLLLLIFPLIWPFISKLIWPREITWAELAAQAVIVSLVVWGVYELGKVGKTSDTEIHSGQITNKTRKHGEYTESYQCNCYTTTSGSGKNQVTTTHCSTCYREHYTVKWWVDTTIGQIDIDALDWTSSAVYDQPNPAEYNAAYIGQPCAGEFSFTNYVKAVPESLFGMEAKMTQQKFATLIPNYPRVYNLYHIARVINVGSKVNSQTLTDLSHQLDEIDKTIGPAKQANIIVIVTSVTDAMYRYAVENAWLGGKKNDIVIFIGSADGKKIDWTDVMTWAMNKGNGIFHATLRDDIMKVGVVDVNQLIPVISADTIKLYTRPHMKDFQYLEKEITPPTWVLILALILGIVASCGCTFAFWKIVHDGEGYYYRSNRYP